MTFGLHLIVRNEAHIISRVLDNADFDQIVVVDTGSDDGTYDLIKNKYPHVELYKYEWNNDFAEARNFSLSKLTTDVFMWLDGDDVYDAKTMAGWRELATKLYNDDNLTHYMLPYHYSVDNEGNPIVIQYRERILKNPQVWQWLEPIHEVLCRKEDINAPIVLINEHPVIHKPNKTIGDPDRNWRILTHNYFVTNNTNTRSLYYLQREGLGRKAFEFAIQMGLELEKSNPEGYHKYDCYKHLGDAYANLGSRDNIKEYYVKAESYYRKAIDYVPSQNEARDALVRLLINTNRYQEALMEVSLFNTAVPVSITAIITDLYLGYKHALGCLLYLNHLGRLENAISEHLLSLTYDNVGPLHLGNSLKITEVLESKDIGIIYADYKYLRSASLLKESLLDRGIFKDVIINTNPMVKQYARKVYFHLSDDINTWYAEEADPHATRILVGDVGNNPTPGWDSITAMPMTKEDVEFILDESVSNPIYTGYFSDLQDLNLQIKAIKEVNSCFIYKDVELTEEAISAITSKSTSRHKINVIYGKDNSLVAITGPTVLLQSLVITDEVVNIEASLSKVFATFDLTKLGVNIVGLKDVLVSIYSSAGTKVAIVANGPEPWDGLIHYQVGMGASETCVIYLAEELVKNGFSVDIFCTTSKPTLVSGVRYLPISTFEDASKNNAYSTVVFSRMPHITERKAQTQIVWLHDMIEVYKDIKHSPFVDHYVCVSDWQREQLLASDPSFQANPYKVVTISNGIDFLYLSQERSTGTLPTKTEYAFVSSPDRGLLNAVHVLKDRSPSLWSFYGYRNQLLANVGNVEVFKAVVRNKNILRANRVKMVGRTPITHVKDFMWYHTKALVYPGIPGFKETFCNTVLEAGLGGAHLCITDNGATLETVKKYVEGECFTPSEDRHYSPEDVDAWYDTIVGLDSNTNLPRLSNEVCWTNIVKIWIPILK